MHVCTQTVASTNVIIKLKTVLLATYVPDCYLFILRLRYLTLLLFPQVNHRYHTNKRKMYCRHVVLNSMLPSATQRLLGMATTSATLPHSCFWSSASSSKRPTFNSDVNTADVSDSKALIPVSSHITHLQSQYSRSFGRLDRQHLSRRDLLHTCLPGFSRLQSFHHMSNGKSGLSKPGRHPLLGTPCSLNGRRGFFLSPKAILDASPPSFQPYLRLIRFDKPIGEVCCCKCWS